MTRVSSTERVEMGATRAALSLGVGPEVARPALRPRLTGEAGHLHKKTPLGTRTAGSESHMKSFFLHALISFLDLDQNGIRLILAKSVRSE
jgi:hypothetical protein